MDDNALSSLRKAEELLAFLHHFLPYGDLEAFELPGEALAGMRVIIDDARRLIHHAAHTRRQ